ncbi:MAG: hypothetical protein M0Z49_11365 [Chloroflexi bacterium]|nr:hypothetical protein [Chloroflexota bacterium]
MGHGSPEGNAAAGDAVAADAPAWAADDAPAPPPAAVPGVEAALAVAPAVAAAPLDGAPTAAVSGVADGPPDVTDDVVPQEATSSITVTAAAVAWNVRRMDGGRTGERTGAW